VGLYEVLSMSSYNLTCSRQLSEDSLFGEEAKNFHGGAKPTATESADKRRGNFCHVKQLKSEKNSTQVVKFPGHNQ